MQQADNVKEVLYLLLIMLLIGALLNWSADMFDDISEIGIAFLIGLIISALTATLVETFSGHRLKKYFLLIELLGYKFSITIFILAAVIVKFGFLQ